MTSPAASAVVLQSGSNWPGVEGSALLLGIILLAGLGTGFLFVVSALAYRQRRSRRYLLITIAVGALVLRSIVGVGTVLGYTPMVVHHLIEHTFDFIIAAIMLYAVFRSKPADLDHRVVDLQTDRGDRRDRHGEQ